MFALLVRPSCRLVSLCFSVLLLSFLSFHLSKALIQFASRRMELRCLCSQSSPASPDVLEQRDAPLATLVVESDDSEATPVDEENDDSVQAGSPEFIVSYKSGELQEDLEVRVLLVFLCVAGEDSSGKQSLVL